MLILHMYQTCTRFKTNKISNFYILRTTRKNETLDLRYLHKRALLFDIVIICPLYCFNFNTKIIESRTIRKNIGDHIYIIHIFSTTFLQIRTSAKTTKNPPMIYEFLKMSFQ
jgi:hypothetical protein